jgi:site-specific recombinase
LSDSAAAPSVLASEAAWPALGEFATQLAGTAVPHRTLKQLYGLLCRFDAELSLAEQVDAFEALGAWLCARRAVPPPPTAEAGEAYPTLRVRWLTHCLKTLPAVRRRLARALYEVFTRAQGTALFGRLGLPTDRGFFAETIDRVSRTFLPEPHDESDLTELLARLAPNPAQLRVLEALPSGVVHELKRALRDPEHEIDPWSALREHLLDAMALLATRISAVGLSDVLRSRSPQQRLIESPFFALPRAFDALLAQVRQELTPGQSMVPTKANAQATRCRVLIQECRDVTVVVIDNLEQHGVSVDVVYRLELISRSLDRLQVLLEQVDGQSGRASPEQAYALFLELARSRQRDRDLGDIIGRNLHLLARKIIERAGHTGEHYITASRSEYFKMLASAGGGGVLTAGTTALKYLIGWAHFAPFVEGALSACNYAGSFILMQLLGFTLATKQPSMTAAALAGTLREAGEHVDLSKLVSLIARIVRSQFAAALGNIGLVIPAAYVFDQVWRTRTATPFLDSETAQYVLRSLHPTQSGTIFFAALTGCLLWFSSIFAGWVENWAVYRRLPEAIQQHRLGRFVGRGTLGVASRFFQRNIAGFGGNSALGVLLAMTPVMGKFVGLPLDVRHVTLSTGALTLSVCTLGSTALSTSEVHAAMLGIALIGTLNFGVSFALALAVALRAREVHGSDRLRLFGSVVATFLRSPWQFVFPPADTSQVRVHGPASVRPPHRD